ncbi:SDR family NAD(P)-dependent oxidoreductase [Neobacillus massiliamazoniensis]|uniref:Short-chain dehydrogenase n=1 Tax=Neobacillus massiliamazoniensis TaxID=1499688 RepID=A0A0U1NW05_9BACI|nr:SDR family oxidoreductase [Neobacillus massiliamazoniensis]CRK82210.1 short-chain dehydrogenase [Neobacillus massiliamazoniensis]
MKKTALITGASSGLGYEFVKLFAKDGYNLVLVARNGKQLEEIKQSFKNIEVTVILKDLSVLGSPKEVFEEVEKQGINIDVLVNNAGFGLMGGFDELDIQKQVNMIQLNVSALTELTYYFLQKMKDRNSGRILNVASTAAFQPGPLMAVYYATKAYVLSFSEALVEELAGSSVTVTTLCPGPTKTNFGSVANVEGTKMFSQAMASDIVAKKGYEAMMSGKRVIVTGAFNKAGTLGAKFMPRSLTAKIAKYIAGEK